MLVAVCGVAFAAWVYLVLGHGRFWLCDQRLDGRAPAPRAWPPVVAVVPARDEADLVPRTLRSLLAQDYPGPLRVVLVDDESRDGTGDAARALAAADPRGERLLVVAAPPRPPGWVGKMWALETGIRAAEREAGAAAPPVYWLLTDADVEHGPDDLRRLVARAERGGLHLVSQMVRLHTRPGVGWDGLLVPAFVYFFQKLYPFPRVNAPRARTAAAAGGCVLVRRDALAAAGGIEAIRGEVIDDCALGRAIKRGGPIWLGHSTRERSLRPYRGLRDVWDMVARSAFTQLRHSWALLAVTVVGLAWLYALPPLAALGLPLHGSAAAGALGAGAWALMAASFVPTLALYERSPLWSLVLPVAGVLYTAMTIDSALRELRGAGATWKGRAAAGRADA